MRSTGEDGKTDACRRCLFHQDVHTVVVSVLVLSAEASSVAEEGLARRFPNRLHLDDYTPGELAYICETCARLGAFEASMDLSSNSCNCLFPQTSSSARVRAGSAGKVGEAHREFLLAGTLL